MKQDVLALAGETKVLLWAAGREPFPDESLNDQVNGEHLFARLQSHRLLGRFLHRFMKERPDWSSRIVRGLPRWCSASLLDESLREFQRERKHVEAHISAFHEITNALGEQSTAIIPVKGFTTYALTGEARHVRASGDLDLFCADTDRVCNTLVRLGYLLNQKDGYHLGRITRDDIVIELHRWFPVWRYPASVPTHAGAAQAFVPEAHSGIWEQPLGFPEEATIRYEDVLGAATNAMSCAAKGVLIPDPCMAVLIHAAHLFRHYLDPPLRSWWPLVRLVDLADTCDLLRHPAFVPSRFLALVTQLHAQEATSFLATLLKVYLDFDATKQLSLPALPDVESIVPPYPHLMTHFGGWALLHTWNDLLSSADPQNAIKRLGTNTVIATKPDQCLNYHFPFRSQSVQTGLLERAVFQPTDSAPLPVALSVQDQGGEGLVFSITLPPSEDYLCVNLMYTLTNSSWQTVVHRGTLFRNDYGAELSQAPAHNSAYVLRIPLPHQKFAEFISSESILYVVVTLIARSSISGWRFGGERVLLLPLRVVTQDLA